MSCRNKTGNVMRIWNLDKPAIILKKKRLQEDQYPKELTNQHRKRETAHLFRITTEYTQWRRLIDNASQRLLNKGEGMRCEPVCSAVKS